MTQKCSKNNFPDGVMEVRMPQEDGTSKVVMYNVPLVKTDGNPQPVSQIFSKFKLWPKLKSVNF
tara:strand:+ start:793 stop:984 length:192 start_codon:yes stop_codon:yes gene_type:complete